MLPAQSWNSSQTRTGFSVFSIAAAILAPTRPGQRQRRSHDAAEADELPARDAAALELIQEGLFVHGFSSQGMNRRGGKPRRSEDTPRHRDAQWKSRMAVRGAELTRGKPKKRFQGLA